MKGDPTSPTARSLAFSTFLVRDYDEAIAFFGEMLGFSLSEEAALGDGNRWDFLESITS